MIDFDYNSREISCSPLWDMKWSLGLRTLFMFFDSQYNQPFDQAAAGSGIFAARNSNNYFGMGPHAGVQLERRLGDSRWSLSMRGDVSGVFANTHQFFQANFTTFGANGRPLVGQTRAFGHQESPIINGRIGAAWRPSPTSATRVFIGYQYEVFWDLDRVAQGNGSGFSLPSMGQLWDQGIVLQATFCY
jgi:hypothetical protein